MKKLSMAVLGMIVVLGLGVCNSLATPYIPPADSPLYIKFSNVEQISPTQSIVAPSGATESNWGVALISSIYLGRGLDTNPYEYPRASSAEWADVMPGEITAIFYGIQLSPNQTAGQINSYNGSIVLYWDDAENADLGTASPADRTWDDEFTNFTDGTLLVKIDFYNGAILEGDLSTAIIGTAVPQVGGFSGFADSYGVVDLTAGGLWADLMNGNYFPVANGLPNADVRFKNSYNNFSDWDSAVGQIPIFGAVSDDPARNFTAVPEPSSLILLGFGLVGLGSYAYRKRMM